MGGHLRVSHHTRNIWGFNSGPLTSSIRVLFLRMPGSSMVVPCYVLNKRIISLSSRGSINNLLARDIE